MRNKERRIRLKSVNPCITCAICRGYLIDATTITECLHTFCKTCIVKYLEEHVTCPICDLVIHQSHPLNYISHDRTMQDIVYKLVPNLQEGEEEREETFYKCRGLPLPRSNSVNEECVENNNGTSNSHSHSHSHSSSPKADDHQDYHRSDEQVNVCLECSSQQLRILKRKFIQCSTHTTITHLKKFVAHKIYSNVERFKDVDILCNDEILGKDHTLKFICLTRRVKVRDAPLTLQYKPKVEL